MQCAVPATRPGIDHIPASFDQTFNLPSLSHLGTVPEEVSPNSPASGSVCYEEKVESALVSGVIVNNDFNWDMETLVDLLFNPLHHLPPQGLGMRNNADANLFNAPSVGHLEAI
ncbi:hypothetical protein DV737_g5225, partial [Chaetothyriales sp. CBS 132003]